METQNFSDFVQEIARGKVLKIAAALDRKIKAAPVEPIYRRYDWAMPSFDFGFIFDPAHSSFIGTEVCNDLWAQASDLVSENRMRLPFRECAFLFRYRETFNRYETVNLVHLRDDGESIWGDTYFQQAIDHPAKSRWTKTPFQFVLHPGLGVEMNFDPMVRLSPSWEHEYRLDLRSKYTEVLYAALLLGTRRASIEEEEIADAMPLIAANSVKPDGDDPKPLPATRIIKVNLPKLVATTRSRTVGTGSEKRPHERRGHYRSLQSGKQVWVNACKIHGGSDAPPKYSVLNAA